MALAANNSMDLENKVVLITGASRGIGKAVAAAFLKEGAKVMLTARSEEELKITQQEFKINYPFVEIAAFDVSNFLESTEVVKKTVAAFRTIDILVNAAGIYGPIGPSEEIDINLWRNTYEVNVFGTFQMIHQVAPIMIKNKSGKIINFSGGGDGPLARFSAYNSSKVAIVRLTETLAVEFKDYNLEVNCLAPGPVNTKFLDEALATGEEKVGSERYAILQKQKADGGVPPEKTAELCVFLASSKSNGLTGKFLSVVWDKWQDWGPEEIKKIMATDVYTLRRVKI